MPVAGGIAPPDVVTDHLELTPPLTTINGQTDMTLHTQFPICIFQLSITTAVEDVQKIANDFTIAPNPFESTLQIHFEKVLNSLCQVYDGQGKNMYNNVVTSQEVVVDTKTWASGIYFVEYEGKVKKVIKK